MSARDRAQRIVSLVEEHGFVSVKRLSEICAVSEMTIRRDLQRLEEDKRLRRTYGGAIALRPRSPLDLDSEGPAQPELKPNGMLVDRVDVLITSSVDPKYDRTLLDHVGRRNIPIIAESTGVGREETVVSVDNYQAGLALGQWAADYSLEHGDGQAFALDLTYQLPNTQARSQGFLAGLRGRLPGAEVVLSINAQSRYETAYKLTTDALTVYPKINVIFAINDTTAWGAIQACRDMGLSPDSVLVLPFGLEGDTLKNALMNGAYCKAGLAMFPEIVGPVCVEAAIAAYNRRHLPQQITTPHAILTREALPQLYRQTDAGWQIDWSAVRNSLPLPLDMDKTEREPGTSLPKRVGFIIPFREHEWYRNLIACMQEYAGSLKIELEIVDADHSLEGEMVLRRRGIAQVAAEQVEPGDVILLDSGLIMTYLAKELTSKQGITVITNSIPVFDILKGSSAITLISTGGLLRPSTDALIGPTAEGALRELRTDKLFLVVTGITLDFGLSHTDLTEVAVKQAMIRAAREIILLADHTAFGHEAVAQVAPTSVVHKVITDEALPASTRLELAKRGIEALVARI